MKSRFQFLLLAVILVAAFLRLFQLGAADVITDEALIAFRSLGYIDFFASPYQTTPYEWFSNIPGWVNLSFHDHPPLVFLLQHWLFAIFGESVFVMRLLFAIAGTVSVYLVYLIGRKLFNEEVGLISAALLAVSSYHVWISRIGLQESVLICLSLLAIYLFLKSFDNYRYWYGWGMVLGLAFLTKYTAFILLPVFFVYLLWKERGVFRQLHFWAALVISFLLFSPVLIYNSYLFAERGHFDLQLSFIFGQSVDTWQYLPGKIQAGSFSDRLVDLVPRLYQGLLLPMSILLVVSAAWLLVRYFRSSNEEQKPLLLLGILFDFYFISFLVTGPASRFVVVVVPVVALIVGWFISQQSRVLKFSLVGVVIVVELFFTINTLFLVSPVGTEDLTYSRLRRDSNFWGYQQLNDFIESKVADKKPAVSFEPRYQFLKDIKDSYIENSNGEPTGVLFVYDQNIDDLAALWIFHRQLTYHGWPVLTADQFVEQDQVIWQQQGIKSVYIVDVIDDGLLQRPAEERTLASDELAATFQNPEIIKRPDGREVFAIYEISY